MAENKKNTSIIAAYAGTGKTTAAKLYPNAAIDLVCMPYKYVLENDPENGAGAKEERKADYSYAMRHDWPRNYVQAIKTAISGDKFILIPTDLHVLALLQLENIPYWLAFPQRNAKETYRKRFLDRGNTENFIDVFIGRWDSFLSAFEQDTYGQHIVLEPCQFLSEAFAF